MRGFPGGFVGRVAELGLLEEALQEAEASKLPSVAVVVGDPGTGKSRLLIETVNRHHPSTIFWVRGTEIEHRVPLSSASELLHSLASRSPSDKRPATPVFDDFEREGLDPVRVFEALHRRLSDEKGVVLVVDDLQWVDDLTLALFSYLLRGAQTSSYGLALLLASRPSPNAAAFIDGISRVISDQSRLKEIELEPLTQDEGIELVRQLSQETDREAALGLWKRAGGSPFWMSLLASSSGDEGSARALVNKRLRGLTPESRKMMALLSLAIRPVSGEEAREVLELTPAGFDEARKPLIDRGLAVATETGLMPSHDLIRETISTSIPEEVTTDLRVRLARAIESRAGADVRALGEAMEHRAAGQLPLIDLALKIARVPGRRLIGEDGLKRLIEIAESESLANPDVLALRMAIARLADEVGSRSAAKDQWMTVAASVSDPLSRARAHLEAARAAFELQQNQEVAENLSLARSHRGDRVLDLEVQVLEAQRLRWLQGDLPEAKKLTIKLEGEARALIDAAGGIGGLSPAERRACGAAIRARLDVAIIEQDVDLSSKLADEAIQVHRDSPDLFIRASLDSALTLVMRGNWLEAERWLRRVWLQARREFLPSAEAEAGFWLSQNLYLMGRLNEARVVAEQALAVGERVGVVPVRISLTWMRSSLPLIDVCLGDWKDALARLREILSEEKSPHYRLRLRWQLALWLARLEGAEAGTNVSQQIDEGLQDALVAGCDRCVTEFTIRGAEALARIGEDTRASSLLTEWDASHSGLGGAQSFWRKRTEAVLAAARKSVEAETLAMEIRKEAQRVGLDLELLWIDLDRAAGQAGELAISGYRGAAELAERMSAMTEHSLAVQALRALGVRPWRRTRKREEGPLAPLSDRELEIARLVAGGATNPEIAESLFLSRKTVERHVSNILSKLQIRNRTELASRLTESERS